METLTYIGWVNKIRSINTFQSPCVEANRLKTNTTSLKVMSQNSENDLLNPGITFHISLNKYT